MGTVSVFCLVLLPGLVVPWAMDGSVFVRCLGDGFDFDEGAGGEVGDFDAGAGRLRSEVLTVDGVERREVVDVLQEAGIGLAWANTRGSLNSPS